MRLARRAFVPAVLALIVCSSPAAGQVAGVNIGPTFVTFSSEELDFETRTGFHVGLFLGSSRDKAIGIQTELNFLRKKVDTQPGRRLTVDYFQVPVLLRLNTRVSSANGFGVYGVVGPAISLRIAEELEGFRLGDGFENFDVGLVFGSGFEVARIIVEGRYEIGMRRLNNITFTPPTQITAQAFTVLFGARFK